MENIDYEKAYKAVLQTATHWIKDGCTDKEKICLESVFPELRESEDERIRKDLIHDIEILPVQGVLTHRPTSVYIAYLEKQKNLEGDFARGYDSGYEACLHSHGAEWFEKKKEQKPEPIFKNEDYFCERCQANAYNAGKEAGLKERKPVPEPHKGDNDNPYDMSFEEAQEYVFHRGFDISWSNCDVFIDKDYIIQTVANVLRWADEHPKEQKPVDLSKMMVHKEPYVSPVPTPMVAEEHKTIKPSGKLSKQEYLYQLMIDNIISPSDYAYLTEQKPEEWSEEDKTIIDCAVEVVEKAGLPSLAASLKSLHPQPHWKPRCGQMSMLLAVINEPNNASSESCHLALAELYDELKKL